MLMPNPSLCPTRLLDTINSPADLRLLTLPELEELARELREAIIATVAQNGGHLAPSLGVVELTIALHLVYDTPNDQLVWDVGHQSYAHKLLTGRRDRFATLRCHQGISGFPKPEESVYDAVAVGHSSTSISYGLGMATARNIQKRPGKVVAIIGDGSMSAGLAFEGLNNAGALGRDLVVVLNDNEMSISENVGALSSFLSRKLTGRTSRLVRDHIEDRLRALPQPVGDNILTMLRKSEESLKSFLTPGMLFEAFKFKYVGPIHGHVLPDLISTLKNVREHNHGPVLVHVITQKGRGYRPAELNPCDYHGVGPFDIATGTVKTNAKAPISYTKAFGLALSRIARQDARVTAITAAMPTGTGLRDFAREFPERFFDVGIAEPHAVTFAAGLALEGLRPCVAVYSSFMQRALDQVIHDVCLPGLPVVFALDRSGVVGADGPTHHGVFDCSFLRFIPNLTLMAPKDENELQRMLLTAFQHDGPVALRYPRGSGEGVLIDDDPHPLPMGKAELLREGTDVLLLPLGNRVYPALAAAEELAARGIDAAVINPRFIKPLDSELLCFWAQTTGAVVTIEDNSVQGGFGSAVLQLFAEQNLHLPVRLLGYGDAFIEQGPQSVLWSDAGIDTPGIVRAVLDLLKNQGAPDC
ncbi:MAG: 1-deoxy-D-xylulose-5-phosphate synthase [Desulfobulbus sp.]|jgi:1-deoxy-D-xylulose-5-phosphate synthase